MNERSKYCLVRFIEDNILYVVLSKRLDPIEENLVWSPYKKMGFYKAIPLEFDDDRMLLEKKKKDMKQQEKERNGKYIFSS